MSAAFPTALPLLQMSARDGSGENWRPPQAMSATKHIGRRRLLGAQSKKAPASDAKVAPHRRKRQWWKVAVRAKRDGSTEADT